MVMYDEDPSRRKRLLIGGTSLEPLDDPRDG